MEVRSMTAIANPVRYLAYICIVSLATILIAGCGTTTTRTTVDQEALKAEIQKQQELSAKAFLEKVTRLHQVSYPLLRASLPYCEKDTRRGIGALGITSHSFPENIREVTNQLWNIGDELVVVAVSSDSPAHKAGLKFGDVVQEVDGKKVKDGKKAIDHFYNLLTEDSEDISIEIVVDRNGQSKIVRLETEPVCDYLILVNHSDAVNAYADGDSVIIATGMMRFASADSDLAIVIAHEIAHNAMGHIEKKKVNYGLGSIVDIIAAVYGVNTQGVFGQMGAKAFSQDFEAEADYVGLYILDHAGYEIAAAPDFWRKMAITHPSNIKTNHGATHPSTPERFLALEQAVTEINTKKEQGIEVRPTPKPKTERTLKEPGV